MVSTPRPQTRFRNKIGIFKTVILATIVSIICFISILSNPKSADTIKIAKAKLCIENLKWNADFNSPKATAIIGGVACGYLEDVFISSKDTVKKLFEITIEGYSGNDFYEVEDQFISRGVVRLAKVVVASSLKVVLASLDSYEKAHAKSN
ncbi:hypothetical protein AYI68_g2555 [Smittium mucronatum]|uniref:Uncharacterized protein n=1 Tax=Smittium mucronatum TaxID=133383 RepID=A0A1R0H2F2_9FUNG|nr:hypothetical protein AYI68_g2555 [Smittium mucronatum]